MVGNPWPANPQLKCCHLHCITTESGLDHWITMTGSYMPTIHCTEISSGTMHCSSVWLKLLPIILELWQTNLTSAAHWKKQNNTSSDIFPVYIHWEKMSWNQWQLQGMITVIIDQKKQPRDLVYSACQVAKNPTLPTNVVSVEYTYICFVSKNITLNKCLLTWQYCCKSVNLCGPPSVTGVASDLISR